MTYRLDPVDDEDQPRPLTVEEISALMRKNLRAIPDAQYAAFTTLFPDLAYLFKHNDG